MTLAEAGQLLALAAAYDSRKPDRARLVAWHDALTGLDPDDCAQAVRSHYRTSTEFVMPGHIRRLVIAAANDRAARSHSWRELQPSAAECIPRMPDEHRALVLQFAARRALPADVQQAGAIAQQQDPA